MTGFEEDAKQWVPPNQELQKDQFGVPHDKSEVGDTQSQEPDDYDAFVKLLVSKVEHRTSGRLSKEVQEEFSNFVALLVAMPRETAQENRVFFEFAFDLLAAEEPNLALVRAVRQELSNVNARTARGVLRYISLICGTTRLSAAISALISVVLISMVIFWIMISSHQALLQNVESGSVLFSALSDGSVELLTIAIHAAFVGGVVSIFARIQDFVDGNPFSPPLVFISVFRKPFLAAAFAVLVFSALKTGLVSFPGVSFSSPTAPFFAWAVGFLCGFSERFAQDYVVSAESRFT